MQPAPHYYSWATHTGLNVVGSFVVVICLCVCVWEGEKHMMLGDYTGREKSGSNWRSKMKMVEIHCMGFSTNK